MEGKEWPLATKLQLFQLSSGGMAACRQWVKHHEGAALKGAALDKEVRKVWAALQ